MEGLFQHPASGAGPLRRPHRSWERPARAVQDRETAARTSALRHASGVLGNLAVYQRLSVACGHGGSVLPDPEDRHLDCGKEIN